MRTVLDRTCQNSQAVFFSYDEVSRNQYLMNQKKTAEPISAAKLMKQGKREIVIRYPVQD